MTSSDLSAVLLQLWNRMTDRKGASANAKMASVEDVVSSDGNEIEMEHQSHMYEEMHRQRVK